ncbi:hypothetical protein Tco_0384156 [Tanacetum coccineum]
MFPGYQFLTSTEELLEANHLQSSVLGPVLVRVRSVGGQEMAPQRCMDVGIGVGVDVRAGICGGDCTSGDDVDGTESVDDDG